MQTVSIQDLLKHLSILSRDKNGQNRKKRRDKSPKATTSIAMTKVVSTSKGLKIIRNI